MNTLEKSIDQKSFFWTILGPLSLLLSMGILTVKHTGGFIGVPLISFVGLAFCFRWKWWGLGLTTVLFLSSLFFQHGNTLWDITLVVSILLGLIITILSIEFIQLEIDELLLLTKDKETEIEIQKNSFDKSLEDSKQQNELLLHNQVNDKKQIEQLKKLIQDKESFYVKSVEFHEQRIKSLMQIQSNDRTQIEQLKNLIQNKENAYLKSVEAQEQSLKSLLQSQMNDKAEIEHLKDLIQLNETATRRKSEENEQKLKSLLQNQANDRAEIEHLNDLIQLNETTNRKRTEEHETIIRDLLEERETLTKNQTNIDNRTLWQSKRKAEGLYEQLREQFEDKSLCLEQTRRELFQTNEALLKMQNDEIEKEYYDNCEKINKLMQHIIAMENEYQSRIQSLEHENESYCQIINKLNDLIKS